MSGKRKGLTKTKKKQLPDVDLKIACVEFKNTFHAQKKWLEFSLRYTAAFDIIMGMIEKNSICLSFRRKSQGYD